MLRDVTRVLCVRRFRAAFGAYMMFPVSPFLVAAVRPLVPVSTYTSNGSVHAPGMVAHPLTGRRNGPRRAGAIGLGIQALKQNSGLRPETIGGAPFCLARPRRRRCASDRGPTRVLHFYIRRDECGVFSFLRSWHDAEPGRGDPGPTERWFTIDVLFPLRPSDLGGVSH